MALRRLDPQKLTPEQFLKHEIELAEAEVRAEIRRKVATWVFPAMTTITLWVLVLLTLALCRVIEVSEDLLKWLIAETVAAVMGFGGIMIAWAFGGRKPKL